MKSIIKYTDEPLDLKVIKDFLPPPSRLMPKVRTVRVTISLSQSSVVFFKRFARKQHTHYQTMIRRLLDLYAARCQT